MGLIVEWKGTNYEWDDDRAWGAILDGLNLGSSRSIDAEILRRAGYEIDVRIVGYYDPGICHHWPEKDFDCCRGVSGPIFEWNVRNSVGVQFCNSCVGRAASICACCPPSEVSRTCEGCGSTRFLRDAVVACSFCGKEMCRRRLTPFHVDEGELAERKRAVVESIEMAAAQPIANAMSDGSGFGRLKPALKKLGLSVKDALRPEPLSKRFEAEGSPALKRQSHEFARHLEAAATRFLLRRVPSVHHLGAARRACSSCASSRLVVHGEDVVAQLRRVAEQLIADRLRTSG